MLHIIFVGVVLSLLGYLFHKWATKYNAYFEGGQLPHLKPKFLLGTSGPMIMKQHHMDDWLQTHYNYFPSAKIVGMFDFRQPLFFLRDPDLIKRMLVKDFDHFVDHKPFVDPNIDVMFGNSLFLMHGSKWRDMRANLSPAFTGSKMRLMFDMVGECAADMVAELQQRTATANAMRTDTKDLFGRYATDVIATAAFGIKTNSIADERNEFFENGKRAMNVVTLKAAAKMVMFRMCPRLMSWLDIQLVDADVSQFFRSMVVDTMQTRLERNIYRPDMINMLMQLKAKKETRSDRQEGGGGGDVDDNNATGYATVEESHIGQERLVERSWTDDELAAQCFLFFVAGFDTTSTLLSFLMYELALNPDVQQRLYEECGEVQTLLNGGRLTYDALQRMPYMDQVVSEALRMWPPVLLTDRLCVRDYRYDDGGDLRFEVLKGQSVWIPIYALHRDEQYFAEPNRFWPERFSDERKGSIVPGTYLPFGVGPRNCIGSRFALMETKAIVYYILLQFGVEPTQETPIPMRLAKAPGAMRPDKPIVLSMKRRAV